MNPPRHPLTTLTVDELPGWISAAEWFRDVLNAQPPMVATSHLLDRVLDMHAIAEGLLLNSQADVPDEEQAEAAQDGLSEAVAEAAAEAKRDFMASPAGRELHHAISRRSPPPPKAETVWTAEREELLRREWPTTKRPSQILEALNLLPGKPCASGNAMKTHAVKLGLRRAPASPETAAIRAENMRRVNLDRLAKIAAAKQAAPEPAETTPRSLAAPITANDPITEDDRIAARAIVLGGAGAKKIIKELGWPEREAQAFAAQVRSEAARAA